MESCNKKVNHPRGFTILEIIAVLIILGVLVAIAIPRFIDVPDEAEKTALKTAVTELNARENLAWGRWKGDSIPYTVADIKADLKGFVVNDDNTLLSSVSYKKQAQITRTEPTSDTPGKWAIVQFIN